MNLVRNSQDPNAMLNTLASQNPQLKSVMSMMNGCKSPKDLFYARAKEMGVDPEEILSQLR